jgi:[ribosomal protein S5]-alanine N-acetyltransferase
MHFYERTKTIEEANQWVSKAEALYQEKRIGFFVCELKETGEFVGICGLLEQKDVDGKNEIEVGYLFVRDHWGKGYATEAALACMEYGFHKLGYDRIISLIDPKNTASIRVAEKNELVKEKVTIFKGHTACIYVKNTEIS